MRTLMVAHERVLVCGRSMWVDCVVRVVCVELDSNISLITQVFHHMITACQLLAHQLETIVIMDSVTFTCLQCHGSANTVAVLHDRALPKKATPKLVFAKSMQDRPWSTLSTLVANIQIAIDERDTAFQADLPLDAPYTVNNAKT